MDPFKPLLNAQRPIPAGTYNPLVTATIVWTRHVLHNLGCQPPWFLACHPMFWPVAPSVFLQILLQHRQDWETALKSIHDSMEP